MIYPSIPNWALVLGLYGRQIFLFLVFVSGMIFLPSLSESWGFLKGVCLFGFGYMIGWYGMELGCHLWSRR